MSVEVGGKRGDQRIRVRDIREGGVIAKDGFIQVCHDIHGDLI